MSRKKTQNVITTLAVAIATVLAWMSGFFTMQIACDTVVGSIVFGSVCAIIVFFESQFSYVRLKSDGRIEITKEEIKSNLWQIVAATLVAFLVTVPLELKIYESEIIGKAGESAHNLGLQIKILGEMFPTNWFSMLMICVLVIAIYQIPIFVRMASEEE